MCTLVVVRRSQLRARSAPSRTRWGTGGATWATGCTCPSRRTQSMSSDRSASAALPLACDRRHSSTNNTVGGGGRPNEAAFDDPLRRSAPFAGGALPQPADRPTDASPPYSGVITAVHRCSGAVYDFDGESAWGFAVGIIVRTLEANLSNGTPEGAPRIAV